MRTHSSFFKEKINQFGRQIKGKIIYYNSYNLISESDDNILSESDLQLISEQANYDDPIEISEENIYSMSINKNGNLLQSLMKELDFEVKEELNIGSVVNAQFGLLIDTTYEYLNYGNYIIYSKEFNMDTETWNYVCYDKMLFSMIKYKGLNNVTYPITIKQYINLLCNKIGLEFEDSNFVNYDQLIYEDIYKDRGLTIRDIFDEISKISAGNLLINDDDKLEVGYPSKAKNKKNANGSTIEINYAENEKILDLKVEGNIEQNIIILPEGYTQVDYIESSGTQYIDTDISASNYLTAILDVQCTSTATGTEIILARSQAGGRWFGRSSAGVYTAGTGAVSNVDSNLRKIVEVAFNTSQISYTIDGTTYSRSASTIDTNRTYTIFAGKSASSGDISYFANARVYNLKFKDSNNNVIYNFIPCYRNSDNVIGLYDIINNNFVFNQGTGYFTYGNIAKLPNPDYPQNVEIVTGEQIVTISQNEQIQNYTIDLGNIELCKIGQFQDYIYNNNNQWYIHKDIKKHIFSGASSDTYQYNTDLSSALAINMLPNKVDQPAFKYRTNTTSCYSNMFYYQYGIGDFEHIYITGATQTTDGYYGNIRLYIDHSRLNGYSSSLTNNQKRDLVKTWLSQNPVTIYYIAKTPDTDIQITDSNLINQLNSLKNATLYNGTNSIIASGDLPIILNFDYISDYDTIDENYLKDINVRMSEKFGVINSVAILDTDNNLQYISEDTQSIKENQMTRVTITDNLLALNGETQNIADNVLNKLKGLYYYINDFTTTGVCYYDYLDMFNVEFKNNIYQCLLLNNEITITQGIEEQIFTDKLEDSEKSSNEYTTSIISNKRVQFKINEQEGKLESKVEKDGVISAINQSAEEIKINANKLSFEGATINMTADNVKIKGQNIDIDSKGTIKLSDNTADLLQSKNASYIIESNFDDEYQGETSHVGYTHEIYANGRKNEYENDNNIQQSSGYGHYFGGVYENLYRYPTATWYMKSADYQEGYSNGSYASISIGVQGINTSRLLNGTWTYGLGISVDGDITCNNIYYKGSLTPVSTSKAERKKNFEKLINAKEILKNVDIYKYNLIEDKDDDKKLIGFVIGNGFNYSKELTTKDNDAVNLYSMVSVLWQVVKEQQEEINELKEMIKSGKH